MISPDQLTQLAVEVMTVISGVGANRALRRRDMTKQANRMRDDREQLEARREDFESRRTDQLIRESEAMRKQMASLESRLSASERKEEQLREEMHSLRGRVDAANETYRQMLEAIRLKTRTVTEEGKPDTLDQTKIKIEKKESPR
jgi:chromosome segregation ATPase